MAEDNQNNQGTNRTTNNNGPIVPIPVNNESAQAIQTNIQAEPVSNPTSSTSAPAPAINNPVDEAAPGVPMNMVAEPVSNPTNPASAPAPAINNPVDEEAPGVPMNMVAEPVSPPTNPASAPAPAINNPVDEEAPGIPMNMVAELVSNPTNPASAPTQVINNPVTEAAPAIPMNMEAAPVINPINPASAPAPAINNPVDEATQVMPINNSMDLNTEDSQAPAMSTNTSIDINNKSAQAPAGSINNKEASLDSINKESEMQATPVSDTISPELEPEEEIPELSVSDLDETEIEIATPEANIIKESEELPVKTEPLSDSTEAANMQAEPVSNPTSHASAPAQAINTPVDEEAQEMPANKIVETATPVDNEAVSDSMDMNTEEAQEPAESINNEDTQEPASSINNTVASLSDPVNDEVQVSDTSDTAELNKTDSPKEEENNEIVVDKNKSNEQYIKDAESKYIVPKLVRTKFPDLIKLIFETESMDKEEREYWLQIMPIMTEDQISKFRGILVNEKEQLSKLDKSHKKVVPQIDEAKLRAKMEKRKKQEESMQEEEETTEENLLSQLESL